MRIYIGGLWAKVGQADLEALINQRLRGPWYKLYAPRGRMRSCELLQMVDLRSGETEYCAVIDVDSIRLGWELIKALDGLKVHGNTLNAHKWFRRTGIFERRATGLVEAPPVGRERRDTGHPDRRRELSIQPLGRNMVRAVRGFERSYGS